MAVQTHGAGQTAPRPLRRAVELASFTMLSVQLLGCAVDDRILEEAPGTGDGGASGGTTNPGGGGGARPEIPVPLCVFDDESVRPECATLVDNPGFPNDARGWRPDHEKVVAVWDERDPSNNDTSGSVKVTNNLQGVDTGVTAEGAGQCLQVRPGTLVQVAADTFIPEGQGLGIDGESFVGRAALTVLFYERADCVSPTVGSFATRLEETVGVWQRLEGQTLVPADVGSMSLRLAAVKNHRQFKLDVLFDNVLLRVIE